VVVILMGVAGSGKTTIGRALAAALHLPYVDADDYHSRENIEKMRRGSALNDADRAPWLAALRTVIIRALERREPLVLACSALKGRYRDALAGGLRQVRFVHLSAPESVLRERLAARTDHFARSNLLESQLATLEPPADAITIDATRPVETGVSEIREELGL